MSQNSNENLSTEEVNVENVEVVDNVEPSTDQSQSEITTTLSIASSSPATSLQSLSLATSIDDKNEKLKIILDNPQNTYYSGQTIRGTISLNCKQKKKIRGKCHSTEYFVLSDFYNRSDFSRRLLPNKKKTNIVFAKRHGMG